VSLAKQQEKRQSIIKPVREGVEGKPLVSLPRSATTNELAEDQAGGSGAIRQQRAAVRRILSDVASPAPTQARAGVESRFSHDFSRVKTHTVSPQIITTPVSPSTIAREWGPDRRVEDNVSVSYDPVTNRVGVVGPGDEAYLRQHLQSGTFDFERGDVEEGGYFTVDIGRLDQAAQQQIAGVLGVDLRVLTGRREMPPVGGERTSPGQTVAPGGQWNGEAILNQLTQIDTVPESRFDQYRCGPTSALAVHILAGPEAVANVAQGIIRRLGDIRDDDDEHQRVRHAAAQYVQYMRIFENMSALSIGSISYRHLAILADALFLVVRFRHAREMLIHGGGAEAVGTGERHMRLLGEAGHAGAPTWWANAWAEVTGSGRVYGQSAITRLPATGERFGMDDLSQVAGQLTQFRLVGLIVAVPATPQQPSGEGTGEEQYVQEGALSHYIALGADGGGRVFVYDPYPRVGNQLIWVEGNESQLECYFLGRWRVEGRLAAASGTAEGPELPQAGSESPTPEGE
jgi:hypothetical protein